MSEPLSEVVLNGRTVATSNQAADASSSDYILIRTTGEPLNKAQKKELGDFSVRIQEFVGNENEQIYLCGYKQDSLSRIRCLEYVNYANVYAPAFAVPSTTKIAVAQPHNAHSDGKVEVDILLHHDISEVSDELLNLIIEAARLEEASAITVEDGFFRAKIDPVYFDRVAAIDEVRVIHLTTEAQLFNNTARQILRFDGDGGRVISYRGDNQLVCVADTGFDKGDMDNIPAAFTGRVRQLRSWGRLQTQGTNDPDGHGTHVCGSVLGSGQHKTQGLIEGTAPGAMLMVQSTFSGFDALGRTRLGGVPPDLTTLFDEAYQAGARIHTNSWGTPLPATGIQLPYSAKSEKIDQYIWDHQDMTILFAAGNDGQDKNAKDVLDGSVNESSLGAEASAKNCITVGASENNRPSLMSGNTGNSYTYGGFFNQRFSCNPLKDDHLANNPEGLAAFSSRGPTAERRLKPDVVAPGTAILSTRSRDKKFIGSIDKQGVSDDDQYMYLSGTSMATPLVAGCCAILREMLIKSGYQDEEHGLMNPTGSLIKALLINGAVPIKGQYMPDNIGEQPNPHSGFGRVDIVGSIVEPTIQLAGYGTGAILEETEQYVSFQIPLPQRDSQTSVGSTDDTKGFTLKVTMVYADQPGGALSNDLNLIVVAGDEERHGNIPDQVFTAGTFRSVPDLSGAMGTYDRSNNVEQIVWPDIPGSQAQIMVRHYRLMAERVPFAFAWKCY